MRSDFDEGRGDMGACIDPLIAAFGEGAAIEDRVCSRHRSWDSAQGALVVVGRRYGIEQPTRIGMERAREEFLDREAAGGGRAGLREDRVGEIPLPPQQQRSQGTAAS